MEQKKNHPHSSTLPMRLGITLLSIGALLLIGCRGIDRTTSGVMRWSESINQLNEGAQNSSLRAQTYEASARQAVTEGLPGAERLFIAMAYAERIQEHHHIQTIIHLGGIYTPPYRPRIFLGCTQQNLLLALRFTAPYGVEEVKKISTEGNRVARRLMIRHMASCNRCLRAVEYYLEQGEAANLHYQICPRCGYLSDNRYPDLYCPQCGEGHHLFKQI